MMPKTSPTKTLTFLIASTSSQMILIGRSSNQTKQDNGCQCVSKITSWHAYPHPMILQWSPIAFLILSTKILSNSSPKLNDIFRRGTPIPQIIGQDKKIPSLCLSIKDLKPIGWNGCHPTRLIVSAHNFMQCLSRLTSKSIEKTFKCAAITYQWYTIQNSLDLKQHLKEKGFRTNDVTTISLDIKDMYPQCWFKAISKAVKHYTSVLDTLTCDHINKCLEILLFSMGNTIVSFQDKYFKYGVHSDHWWLWISFPCLSQSIVHIWQIRYVIQ